tara:strand:+ start:220 stop:558 length:339 start_codon:yes stop_codon:yes gene_type:complete
MAFKVHPTAIIENGAMIGNGSRVWHWTNICGGKKLEITYRLVKMSLWVIKLQSAIAAKFKTISLYDNVHLEEGVFCGPSIVFTSVYNPRALIERKDQYLDTLVKKGATLGAN